mmetsp:Transcript_13796/g.32860  ORF Transcript_13796/g.32860 Transcript_13796/m.32860 type:complete len:150 (+) Transcript_13796:12-461(+)
MEDAIQRLPDGLDTHIGDEGGAALSVGQKQLICLARALLRKAKVVVLDEASSSVDPRTDHVIHQTIRRYCVGATLIIVAHRLQSVMDVDRIFVMEDGQIIEDGAPEKLLEHPASLFSRLVAQQHTAHHQHGAGAGAGGIIGSPLTMAPI